mmetsp:Transcript_317/g.607  ORF Transcript_317/g.607 Transcript_317/m.607 type:complete len:240 (+) Transcript_317:61-780(+)
MGNWTRGLIDPEEGEVLEGRWEIEMEMERESKGDEELVDGGGRAKEDAFGSADAFGDIDGVVEGGGVLEFSGHGVESLEDDVDGLVDSEFDVPEFLLVRREVQDLDVLIGRIGLTLHPSDQVRDQLLLLSVFGEDGVVVFDDGLDDVVDLGGVADERLEGLDFGLEEDLAKDDGEVGGGGLVFRGLAAHVVQKQKQTSCYQLVAPRQSVADLPQLRHTIRCIGSVDKGLVEVVSQEGLR